MSLKQPRECNNCGLLIYWDKTVPGNPKNRPFDADNPGNYHRCFGSDSRGHEPNPKIDTTPALISCKFRCGAKIIYDTEAGKYKEGSLGGPEHKCPNLPPSYENNKPPHSFPNTNVHEDIITRLQQQQPQQQIKPEYNPQERQTLGNDTTQKQPSLLDTERSVIIKSLQEQNVILQGIAAQLQKLLDTQEVSLHYQRTTKDIMSEWRDELITMSKDKQPPITFENGRMVPGVGETTTEADDTDIYDEISDRDDKTDSGILGDIGGFKPSDTGNKGVRSDL